VLQFVHPFPVAIVVERFLFVGGLGFGAGL
jgi:hypothetical protein